MKGSQKVIDKLNELLTQELSAMDQYTVQGYMLDDWGYAALHERIAHEADDERGHVGQLISRILFLEGVPDVASRTALSIGATPREILANDLALEEQNRQTLNDAIALCLEEGDAGSRDVLQGLLRDTEEDHILWFRTQLRLMDELGDEAYLAEQI